MIPCIYTKDKKKKLKKWEEGFYKYKNKKISVYDTDKKLICTKATGLSNEIETFKYIIYIENIQEELKDKFKEEELEDGLKEDKFKEEELEDDKFKEEELEDDKCKDKCKEDKTLSKRTNKELLNLFKIKKRQE
ncbi:uncharacterized protein VNE69_05026 [Vairimorpha necatrix]|uniref:5'-3' DNA helicase ZGRF1-like N-terminal domain-containing protein n=1 Tax=Vairimorpha necatrix TaxID=6039 RepID=A0AAX4JBX1_9MICR